jgi:RNA polymerase sigma-70 factor (ECF subfamily)
MKRHAGTFHQGLDMMSNPRMKPPAPTAEAAQRAAFVAWVERLVHQHRGPLASVARREGLTPADAFDAVQEAFHTFLALPEAAPLVDAAEPSRKLLVTLTRNAARNRRRLHAVARPHDDRGLEDVAAAARSVEETLLVAEEHVRLEGCMRTLAEIPRAVITLRLLDDRPGEDVARTLGITPGHVAVLLHRAKASLLACMTSCHGPDGA